MTGKEDPSLRNEIKAIEQNEYFSKVERYVSSCKTVPIV